MSFGRDIAVGVGVQIVGIIMLGIAAGVIVGASIATVAWWLF